MIKKKIRTTKKAPLIKRFFDKIIFQEDFVNDCWLWDGRKNQEGYGLIHEGDRYSKLTTTHRLSWEFSNKTIIPSGMCILHSCDNPSCVNPNHLSIGTQAENIKDMDQKGRRVNTPQKGEKSHFSKLTEQQVLQIRKRKSTEKITHKQLARAFRVCRSTITLILNRNIWNHI